MRNVEQMPAALKIVSNVGILPVIAVPALESAVSLADALVKGGVNVIEVTLRNPWAVESISRIRQAHPDIAIGAGTILETRQIAEAREAGADFLVTPGLDAEIVADAREAGLPIVPGVTNPTEIATAVKLGLTTLKFFPAEISGGVSALTLYHGPFPDVSFVPTGGMTMDNIGSYLTQSFVAACGGSFMAKGDDIKAGAWEKISENCRKCIEIVREARS